MRISNEFRTVSIYQRLVNGYIWAVMDAGAEALAGKLRDIGISDDFMKNLAANLTEGTSDLSILIRRATLDKVLDRLKQSGLKGKVPQTSFTVDEEDELRKVLEG
jgi:uncharacterized membrane protein